MLNKHKNICIGNKEIVFSTMGTAINHAAAMKRLEALFTDVKLDSKGMPEIVEVETRHDLKCDVHGKAPRRGSLGNILHTPNRRDSLTFSTKTIFGGNGVGPRRESMPVLNNNSYYR